MEDFKFPSYDFLVKHYTVYNIVIPDLNYIILFIIFKLNLTLTNYF